MKTPQKMINNKQRVIIVCPNARHLILSIINILEKMNIYYDYILENEQKITDAPVIFIENQYNSYKHHILVLGNINNIDAEEIKNLADKTPKAGTIIYNKQNKNHAAFKSFKKKDVQILSYTETTSNNIKDKSIESVLLERFGVHASSIKN